MNIEDKRKIVADFIGRHKLAVLSTIDANAHQPESAVLGFIQGEPLEIIFDTYSTSRKYKNLQSNKKIALVIGWDEHITVQYEGIVEKLKSKKLETYRQMYPIKFRKSEKSEHEDILRYFSVRPTWIRYSDVSKKPWNIFEVVISKRL
jgi:general stress protein 26